MPSGLRLYSPSRQRNGTMHSERSNLILIFARGHAVRLAAGKCVCECVCPCVFVLGTLPHHTEVYRHRTQCVYTVDWLHNTRHLLIQIDFQIGKLWTGLAAVFSAEPQETLVAGQWKTTFKKNSDNTLHLIWIASQLQYLSNALQCLHLF